MFFQYPHMFPDSYNTGSHNNSGKIRQDVYLFQRFRDPKKMTQTWRDHWTFQMFHVGNNLPTFISPLFMWPFFHLSCRWIFPTGSIIYGWYDPAVVTFLQKIMEIFRWWIQIFVIFIPIWGRFPFWLYNIFQMGWNHQPEMVVIFPLHPCGFGGLGGGAILQDHPSGCK